SPAQSRRGPQWSQRDGVVEPPGKRWKKEKRRTTPRRRAGLYPLKSTFLVCPDVSHRQYDEENSDLRHAKPLHLAIPDCPGKQEDGLHVEDDEQDSDDVKPYRVAASGIRGCLNSTLVGFQFFGERSRWPDQLGRYYCHDGKSHRDCQEDENRQVIAWHGEHYNTIGKQRGPDTNENQATAR